ncbi:hypothetical protein [Companilactobacillus mishanensis]|uniref:DUF2798 domain-containing protein n=1 Tax=Companilactobacillus mishanensis TaxID=2486008 RepID=A0A5P0ZIN9_9LACO|nr:hypothetical protein [Companilactobacillus mishanensis]MQS52976.1 hypothetical protein [Companilactobacillus mishanensis]
MTLKERILFTLFMCIGMATSMTWLGLATSQGVNPSMWHIFLISILPTIGFAFIFNFLIVGNISNLLVKLWTRGMTNQEAIGLKAGEIRGWTMLLIMSFTMSTRALIINGSIFHMTILTFLLGYFVKLTMAHFIRAILVMPAVRRIMLQAVPNKIQVKN